MHKLGSSFTLALLISSFVGEPALFGLSVSAFTSELESSSSISIIYVKDVKNIQQNPVSVGTFH